MLCRIVILCACTDFHGALLAGGVVDAAPVVVVATHTNIRMANVTMNGSVGIWRHSFVRRSNTVFSGCLRGQWF